MTSSAPTIDPRIYARRWKILAVMSLSLVIIGLDNTILNVALPSLREHFGASNSTLQWIVDSYLLVFAGLLLTMGTLGDRFGRKRALQAGLAIFGAASLAVLAADSANQLIAIRAAMGAGAALIMPATLSIITNVFPREERGKAIGIWAGMAAIGIGLGPLFGGLLLEWFSWTSVFLVNVPVTAIAILAGVALVPESRDPRPGRFDLVGAGLSIAALVSLVYGVIEAPERGWTNPLILSSFAAAAVLIAAFVRWELHTPEPMLNLSFFRNPRFSVGSAAISIAFFSLFGSIFALTQYLQDAKGYSALQAGAAMVPLAFGLVIGAGSSIKLVARLGTTRVVTAGLVGIGGLLATTLAWTPEMSYWPLGLWFFGASGVDRLDHGAGDRFGHGRRARGEGRRRLGDERRRSPGRGRAGRRRDRLARRLALLRPRRGRHGRTPRGASHGSLRLRRRRRRHCRRSAGQRRSGTRARRRERLHRGARTRPPRRRRGGTRRRGRRLAPPACAPPAGGAGAEGAAGRRSRGRGRRGRLTLAPC